jgi:hypothetical protein
MQGGFVPKLDPMLPGRQDDAPHNIIAAEKLCLGIIYINFPLRIVPII